jgi:hypothetical protein
MRGFDTIAIVIGVFFAVGIAVGMLLVIALPLLRSMHWERRNRRINSGNWWKLPPPGADGERRHPRWPSG